MSLVLASSSPRRYQILALLQVPFLMIPPEVMEKPSSRRTPQEEVLHFARIKAESQAARFPDAVLIGSDTLIHVDGDKIGKPDNLSDARAILTRLCGRAHEVLTAVVLLQPKSGRSFERVETVEVVMRRFSDAERDAYLGTGESLDKAGAYSLQGEGRGLLTGLHGDYLAAVGLPLKAVAEGLEAMVGLRLPVDPAEIYRTREFLNWRTFDSHRQLEV